MEEDSSSDLEMSDSETSRLNDLFYGTLVESNARMLKLLLDLDDCASESDKRAEATKLLGYSIKNRQLESARMLLERGACVRSPVDDDSSNRTALQLAVALRDKPMVDLLLEYQADPRVVDSKYQSLLHLLLENTTANVETSPSHQQTQDSIIEIAKVLVARGLDVNKKTKCHETPLYYAVQRRLMRVAEFLVDHGAAVNCANKKGETVAFALLESDKKIREVVRTLIHFRQSMSESVKYLKWLISVGLNIDAKTRKGKSALELASESDAKHLMNVLLEHTQDIHLVTKRKQQTILHLLFQRHSGCSQQLEHDNAIARKLIDKGAPIDVADADGDTPFHVAASQRRLDVLCWMLDRGIDIHATDKKATPIWRIAMDSFVDARYEDRIIALVRQESVDVNRKNQYGKTPVETAARYKHAKLLRVLDELGADFGIMNDNNENLLHVISKPVGETTPRFDKAMVDLLVGKGCNVNAFSGSGMTPLHVACRLNDNAEVVKALIEHGANIRRRERHTKRLPLHLAAAIGDVDLVKCLVELGAEVECKDDSAYTPLHLAAREGHRDVVRSLAEVGANVNAENNEGLTPILTAVRYNFRNQADGIVETLIASGANVRCRLRDTNFTPLHEATMRKNANVVRCLLHNGADVACQDNANKLAPLHVAAQAGDVMIVEMLVEHGADIHCREKNLLTPLHEAVQKENDEVIRYLVKRGADIDATDVLGLTPLYSAVRSQNKSVETLLELGARMDLRDSLGYTALHHALNSENRAAFDLLIEYRANVDEVATDVEFVEKLIELRSTAEALIHHVMKLQTLGFPVSQAFQRFVDTSRPQIKAMHQSCLDELALLKKSVIKDDEESSLFAILHMHPYKRYAFYARKEFKPIIDRRSRNKLYPIFGDIVMASYRETMSYEKLFLTGPARRAWYNLTEIYLPEICVNLILTHLDLEDLKRMIKGDRTGKRKKSPTAGTRAAKKPRASKT